MQMYGNFAGIPLSSALFGLVVWWLLYSWTPTPALFGSRALGRVQIGELFLFKAKSWVVPIGSMYGTGWYSFSKCSGKLVNLPHMDPIWIGFKISIPNPMPKRTCCFSPAKNRKRRRPGRRWGKILLDSVKNEQSSVPKQQSQSFRL